MSAATAVRAIPYPVPTDPITDYPALAQAAANLLDPALPPVGSMLDFAGAAAPAGWLMCDGASVLRADYPALFTALGGVASPWGLPDGTHFNVPDTRGRVTVTKGTNADVDVLGENDGAALADRRPRHKHTVANADKWGGAGNTTANTASPGVNNASTDLGDVPAAVVGPTAAGTPTDTPSYVVVNKIIKT